MTVQLSIVGEEFWVVISKKDRLHKFEREACANSSILKHAGAAKLTELFLSLHILVVDLG